ncbi:zinc transporter 7 isoform X2 [Carcharodon carcharias]|uniref:zinc transporter 7 isoform X2 n=1 Tax=Carcharodon carcharias TaxID=13397 RepID=UPI001B7E9354|nr:zinc transporter 7 isoform X2 [Carcharodon carcharias]
MALTGSCGKQRESVQLPWSGGRGLDFTMLPLSIKDDEYKPPRLNLLRKVSGWFRSILSDSTSRNLFFFLMLNLSFAFVELLYGIWSNRYVRAEVLAGFVNGLFLIFTAFFIFSEGIERALEPPEVHHDRLLSISVLGFLVNLVGIFVFKHGGHGHSHDGGHGHSHSLFNGGIPGLNHGHSHGEHGHGHGEHGHSHGHKSLHSHDHSHGHGHSHSQEHHHEDYQCDTLQAKGSNKQILEGVFLHIVADTLGSIGVIISALLMQNYGLMIADPICSMLISFLIGISVIPLLKQSIGILMQRTPPSLDHMLPQCYQRVQHLQGVYSIIDPHFWTLCSEVYIGTVKLLVAPDADARWILSQTHSIFTQVGVRQLYVQIDFAAL